MEKTKEKALKLANKKITFVGSVNENNVPNIKAMLVAKHEGLKTFYFTSKIAKKCPKWRVFHLVFYPNLLFLQPR
jgi:general stress protein 26